MRPLKLTMSAFGPYAGEQIIDFAELNGRNIFLITGPTGAGKTTIFDAICYAIFGKGSGRDRDGENMRSDFAADNSSTSVELEFELNGRRYYIKRKPKQYKKKARGDGYTEQTAEAEFKELSDDNPETIAGIREVNEKVQQILGISYEQFKQIIMIPQGEFRELLTSDSKDRESILQRIFGTEGFRRVQDRLVEQEKGLREEVKLLITQRDENIRRIDCGSNEALAGLTEAANINIAAVTEDAQRFILYEEAIQTELQQAEKDQDILAAAKQKEIFKAQEINRKFVAKEEAWKNKELLESKAGEYRTKEEQLQLARKTFSLRGLEDNLAGRRDAATRKQEMLEEAVRQLADLHERAAAAKNSYDTELAKEADRVQFQEQLTVLKGYADRVKELDLARVRQREAESALRKTDNELSKAKESIEVLKTEIKENHGSLADARSAAAEYAEQAAQLEAVSQKSDRILKLQTENDRLETLRRAFEVKQTGLKREKEILDSKQREFNEIRDHFLRGQAGLLAKGLIDGEACPVCGSSHHPLPAVLAVDIPTEDQLKALEASLQQASEQYEKIRDEFEKTKAEGMAQRRMVETLKQEVAEWLGEGIAGLEKEALSLFIKDKALILANRRRELSEQVKELESRKQREAALSQSLTEKEQRLTVAEDQLSGTNNQYVTAFADEQSAKNTVTRLLAEIPAHVQGQDVLAMEIGRAQDKLQAAKEAFKQAEEDYRKASLEFEKKLTERQACELAVNEAAKDLADAEMKFNNGLRSAGFSDLNEYQAVRMTEEDAAELEQEIGGYREKLSIARETYHMALTAVEGLSLVDIARLEEELSEVQTTKADIARQRTELFARIKHNRDILVIIDAANTALGDKEREYGVIAELANTAKGNNEEKLSFERYVLAAFFEDIIEAANIRLAKMTGGRYEMSRITERGKGTAQSGLEIEVFDNYTGRSRHIKTLSGGESFKASLALALGLADVVQAYAGGISLDTMFIDEGFGTLDPESLDNAVNCLVELQHSGRLVGIISHVPELKASIDARLEIEAGKDGSRARFCIM